MTKAEGISWAVLAAGLVWSCVLYMILWIASTLVAYLYMKILWRGEERRGRVRKV